MNAILLIALIVTAVIAAPFLWFEITLRRYGKDPLSRYFIIVYLGFISLLLGQFAVCVVYNRIRKVFGFEELACPDG